MKETLLWHVYLDLAHFGASELCPFSLHIILWPVGVGGFKPIARNGKNPFIEPKGFPLLEAMQPRHTPMTYS
jgi:hypothetical protein